MSNLDFNTFQPPASEETQVTQTEQTTDTPKPDRKKRESRRRVSAKLATPKVETEKVQTAKPSRKRAPKAARTKTPIKFDVSTAMQAAAGLNETEVGLLTRTLEALGNVSKKSRAKIIAALGKLFK